MKSETRQKLFILCTENGVPEEIFNNMVRLADQDFFELRCSDDEAKRKIVILERQIEALGRLQKETYQRHNAKMMSVVYLLDTIKSAGTHHEKAVVITHLRSVLTSLLESDSIPYTDNDLLPF